MNAVDELVILQGPLRILRWLQLWPQPGENVHGIRPKIRLALAMCCFNLVAFGVFLRGVYLIQHPEYVNLSDILEDATNAVAHIIIYYAIYTLISHKSEIEEFMWDLNDFREFGQPATIHEMNKFCNWFCYLFYGYCTIGMFNASLLDLMNRKQCLREDINHTRICGFPIPILFLFAIDDSMSYLIFWIINCVSFLHFINCGSVIMAFVYANVELFTTKIAHLKAELSQLGDDPQRFRENLKYCVDYHVKLIKMCENFNAIWGRLMLYHQLMVSIILSMIGILFILNPGLKFAVYAVGWLVSLAIPCYAGQRLLDESCNISLSMYSACWFHLDARDQKNLVYMIMRANNYLALNRDGYGPMNLSIVGDVVNNIYSLLMLIYESMKEHEYNDQHDHSI